MYLPLCSIMLAPLLKNMQANFPDAEILPFRLCDKFCKPLGIIFHVQILNGMLLRPKISVKQIIRLNKLPAKTGSLFRQSDLRYEEYNSNTALARELRYYEKRK